MISSPAAAKRFPFYQGGERNHAAILLEFYHRRQRLRDLESHSRFDLAGGGRRRAEFVIYRDLRPASYYPADLKYIQVVATRIDDPGQHQQRVPLPESFGRREGTSLPHGRRGVHHHIPISLRIHRGAERSFPGRPVFYEALIVAEMDSLRARFGSKRLRDRS